MSLGLGGKFERSLIELVFRKYILKFRNTELNKLIKEKCSDLYEVRRSINKEIKELKDKLLSERDIKRIEEIQRRISELMYELAKIEEEIKERANVELKIKEEIKKELRNIEKDIKNKIKVVIDKENDIRKPVKEAIDKNDPLLALIIVKPDEGVEPEGEKAILEARTPALGKGVRGVRVQQPRLVAGVQ